MTKAEMAEKKARKMIANYSLARLLDVWEMTTISKDENISIVRGWLMDEFEKRNSDAYDRWLDEDCRDENLRKYMMTWF